MQLYVDFISVLLQQQQRIFLICMQFAKDVSNGEQFLRIVCVFASDVNEHNRIQRTKRKKREIIILRSTLTFHQTIDVYLCSLV